MKVDGVIVALNDREHVSNFSAVTASQTTEEENEREDGVHCE